jgi:hypothetical protein
VNLITTENRLVLSLGMQINGSFELAFKVFIPVVLLGNLLFLCTP